MSGKKWEPDPNDPILQWPGPHELAGVVRWHRNRVPASTIMKLLSIKGTQLAKALERGATQEKIATDCGRPIHAAVIPKESE